MCPQADEINVVLFRVIKYFAVRLALADDVLDVAPKMPLFRNGSLQTVRCFVIGSFPAEWVPGDFGFIYRIRR
jgi:hypothetical protein